jgi:hypothetical protein
MDLKLSGLVAVVTGGSTTSPRASLPFRMWDRASRTGSATNFRESQLSS